MVCANKQCAAHPRSNSRVCNQAGACQVHVGNGLTVVMSAGAHNTTKCSCRKTPAKCTAVHIRVAGTVAASYCGRRWPVCCAVSCGIMLCCSCAAMRRAALSSTRTAAVSAASQPLLWSASCWAMLCCAMSCNTAAAVCCLWHQQPHCCSCGVSMLSHSMLASSNAGRLRSSVMLRSSPSLLSDSVTCVTGASKVLKSNARPLT